jgi:hypothetical protein
MFHLQGNVLSNIYELFQNKKETDLLIPNLAGFLVTKRSDTNIISVQGFKLFGSITQLNPVTTTSVKATPHL